MACSLDCERKRALMLCAVSCDPSRKDLAAFRDVSLQLVDILVADLAFFSGLSFFCGIRSVFFCIRLLRFSDKPFELSLLFIPAWREAYNHY